MNYPPVAEIDVGKNFSEMCVLSPNNEFCPISCIMLFIENVPLLMWFWLITLYHRERYSLYFFAFLSYNYFTLSSIIVIYKNLYLLI